MFCTYIHHVNYSEDELINRTYNNVFFYFQIVLIHNTVNGKPRGYAFIEYEHERDMHCKYRNKPLFFSQQITNLFTFNSYYFNLCCRSGKYTEIKIKIINVMLLCLFITVQQSLKWQIFYSFSLCSQQLPITIYIQTDEINTAFSIFVQSEAAGNQCRFPQTSAFCWLYRFVCVVRTLHTNIFTCLLGFKNLRNFYTIKFNFSKYSILENFLSDI